MNRDTLVILLALMAVVVLIIGGLFNWSDMVFRSESEAEYGATYYSTPLDVPSERLVTSARIKSVYDGDTVVIELTKEIRVRMLDCWAPEIRTTNAEEKILGFASKEFLQSMLEEGDIVLVDIPMTNKLQDSFTFGRVLAYIYKDTDGDDKMDNISEKMVEGGHATKTK